MEQVALHQRGVLVSFSHFLGEQLDVNQVGRDIHILQAGSRPPGSHANQGMIGIFMAPERGVAL